MIASGAVGRLLEKWSSVVGPQLAAVSTPDTLTAEGVLWVRTSAAWADALRGNDRIVARVAQATKGRVRAIEWSAPPVLRVIR